MENVAQVVEAYIHPNWMATIGQAIIEVAKDADEAHDMIAYMDGLFGTNEEKAHDLRRVFGR